MNVNKKYYPFIPIIGIVLTCIADPKDTDLENPYVFFGCMFFQAACIICLLGFLGFLG